MACQRSQSERGLMEWVRMWLGWNEWQRAGHHIAHHFWKHPEIQRKVLTRELFMFFAGCLLTVWWAIEVILESTKPGISSIIQDWLLLQRLKFQFSNEWKSKKSLHQSSSTPLETWSPSQRMWFSPVSQLGWGWWSSPPGVFGAALSCQPSNQSMPVKRVNNPVLWFFS